MAKQAGLGDQLFVGGYDISGDVGSIERIAAPSGVLDVTGINTAGGHERIHSHIDGEIAFNHFFNDAALAEFVANKAKGSDADRVAAYFRGSAIGNVAAGLVAKQINYDWTRAADGSLSGPTQLLANAYGLDWCVQLTAGKRTDTSATDGASLNNAASTATGFAAYLEVFSVVGTSVTVAIQESSDDGGSDAYASIVTFTAVLAAAVGAERKALAALTTPVEQYLRVKTTGTFSSAVFAVCATRTPYAL